MTEDNRLPTRRTICGLLLALLAGSPLLAGANRWTRSTPDWGPELVTLVLVHPQNPRVILARGEGLWRSDDGGTTWQRLPLTEPVLTVALDPRSDRVLYVEAPTGGGVLRSTDSGRTWVPTAAPGTSPPFVYELTIAPSDGDILFAYSFGRGIYRSRNSGATWERVLEGAPFVGITVDPTDANVVYVAAVEQGVLRSTDGGDQWTPANTGLLLLGAVSIAIDAGDPSRLHLANAGFAFRSTDRGATWLPAHPGIPNLQQVASVPGVPNAAYARTLSYADGGGIYRTTDGGETWSPILRPPGPSTLHHLAPDPGRPESVYVADSTLWRTRDSGTTWARLDSGPPLIAGRALAVSPLEPGTVYAAGGLARFSLSSDSGGRWLTPENRDFGALVTNNLAAAPTTPERVYAGTRLGVFRTDNRGASWDRVGAFGVSSRVITDPGDLANLIVVTTSCARFYCLSDSYRSADGGASWVRLAASEGQSVYAVLLVPTLPRRLFAGSDLGLLRGDPAGPFEPLPEAPSFAQLAVDPLDPATIYGVGYRHGENGARLFRSHDVGSTWSEAGELPSAITILGFAIDPLAPEHMVVATDRQGVLRTTDGGATWKPFDDHLPETYVSSIAFSSDGRTLYGGTPHAVYAYTFCSDCPPRADHERPTRTLTPRP